MERCKAVCEPSTAQMCHTWVEPTREGSNPALSQETSGSSGSCAKAGRETPQPHLEQLPAAPWGGKGPKCALVWSGPDVSRGSERPKKPQPCLGKEVVKRWEMEQFSKERQWR